MIRNKVRKKTRLDTPYLRWFVRVSACFCTITARAVFIIEHLEYRIFVSHMPRGPGILLIL